MSNIFRLYVEGGENISCWGATRQYDPKIIDGIKDPSGDSSKNPITSIPSPFARIDLVKTAFAKVVKMAGPGGVPEHSKLDGRTIHHKLVSDCLDVGQIFFDFDKYKSKLQILVWEKEKHLKELLNSGNPKHRQLGETYRIYLEQDGEVYNFQLIERIYLLQFTPAVPGKKGQVNIIGATSPATLFFTPANNLDYVKDSIKFNNNHSPFDGSCYPLWKRDKEYIKYLCALKKNFSNFSTQFKEMNDYIEASFGFMDQPTLTEANAITAADINNYSDIEVGGSAGQLVEVLRCKDDNNRPITVNLKQRKVRGGDGSAGFDSDFFIASDYKIDKPPLVLPVGQYTRHKIYIDDAVWNSNNKVPYKDEKTDINKRKLPEDGLKYPYLTISDFLTDTILQLPGKINKESFYDGNIKDSDDDEGYLLPLQKRFFEYFKPEKLEDIFKLKKEGDNIVAVLRVPIRNNDYIEYKRTYFQDIDEPNIEEANEGAQKLISCDCSLFPNVKFNDDVDAFYRFGLVVAFEEKEKYGVEFVKDNEPIKDEDANGGMTLQVRNETHGDIQQCKNYLLNKTKFDYIRLTYLDKNNFEHSGIILQQKPHTQKEGGKAFIFAVDIGTTNTHIECMEGDDTKTIKVFDITKGDKQKNIKGDEQIHWLHGNDSNIINYYFDAEYIPQVTNEIFKFPMRTAISCGENISWGTTEPFGKSGIAALYGKRKYLPYHEIMTDIKWSPVEGGKLADTYIQNISFLLRNKVILNNGDLKKTKIKWFYPVSMSDSRRKQLKSSWEDAYEKYFDKNPQKINDGRDVENVVSITESVAPYEYWIRSGRAENIVTIDIGGGTSDVVIAKGNNVTDITSFRFAANAIFGDGYSEINDKKKCGIVRQFVDTIIKELENAKIERTKEERFWELFDEMQKENSSEFASYLFSLKDNKTVRDKGGNFGKNVDFTEILKADTTQKITFMFFYSAIIYHLAKIIKAKRKGGEPISLPDTIVFSGNGSRVIQFFSDDKHFLEAFTRKIIEEICEETYSDRKKLEINLNIKNPKEATCKGGLYAKAVEPYSNIRKKMLILHSNDNSSFAGRSEYYKSIDTDEYINETVAEAEAFIDFVLGLRPFLDEESYEYDRTSIDIAENICKERLDIYTRNGLKLKKEEGQIGDKDPIEETLFFYPLVGMLNALSDEICKKNGK